MARSNAATVTPMVVRLGEDIAAMAGMADSSATKAGATAGSVTINAEIARPTMAAMPTTLNWRSVNLPTRSVKTNRMTAHTHTEMSIDTAPAWKSSGLATARRGRSRPPQLLTRTAADRASYLSQTCRRILMSPFAREPLWR
ncbi:hypothetical protein [Dietzia alimentaria]|uniref:hypothetical protein n=1 Tax=Dietzia alimentaria TaxID=665550 RepID=UPI001EE67DE7|nr:hypothetical protein [Dietzia alimentaria]